jgi:hypothetical protein
MLRADYGDGARIILIHPDGSSRVLTEGFHSACDPEISFDGTRMLLAGKRSAGDPWNIFEMELEGADDDVGLRQITRDTGNCRSPVYQSTLYTIDSTEPWYQLTFVSDAAGMRNDDGSGRATHLYSCKLDGSSVRRLTYNVSSDFDPFLMSDGRLLLSSWQRSTLKRGTRGRVRLFGINLDGTDYALLADPAGPAVHSMACVTSAGLLVFVTADRVPWDGAGQLACVSYRRPLRSYRPITRPQDGLFHGPSPWPDGAVLVSRRDADGRDTHAVGRFDPSSGHWQAVFDDPDWHDIQARIVHRRPEADGRSSVVTERDPHGKLYCLNVYINDLERSEWLPRGTVKGLRVIEAIPRAAESPRATNDRRSQAGSWSSLHGSPPLAPRKILGEIQIEQDGSFQLEVPANTPIELQTLDADGMALRTCSWIWAKNHEPRGCIGCHEDGELTPENLLMDAASVAAVRLPIAGAKNRTVDFRRDLMPIIEQKCVPCHGAGAATPRLDGGLPPIASGGGESEVNRAYRNLLATVEAEGPSMLIGKYVQPGKARTSPLIWHLFGRNTSRPWDTKGGTGEKDYKPIPPGQVEPLSNKERRSFVEWIDLGASWHGDRKQQSEGPDS